MLLALAQTRQIPVPDDLQTVNIPETIEAVRISTGAPNAARSPTFAYSSSLNLLQNLYDKLKSTRKSSTKRILRIGCKLSTPVTLCSEEYLSES